VDFSISISIVQRHTKTVNLLTLSDNFCIMIIYRVFVSFSGGKEVKMGRTQVAGLVGCWIMLIVANNATADLINVALQTNGAIATADSWVSIPGWGGLGSGPPEKAIDGSHAQFATQPETDAWGGQSIPGWLMVEFDDIYRIEEIHFWFYCFSSYTFSVELSTNATDWITAIPSQQTRPPYDVCPVYAGAPSEPRYFEINPTNAKYMRLNVTDPTWGSYVLVSELEAYAVPEPTSTLFLGLGGLAILRRRKA
jgi:hypothetical protein